MHHSLGKKRAAPSSIMADPWAEGYRIFSGNVRMRRIFSQAEKGYAHCLEQKEAEIFRGAQKKLKEVIDAYQTLLDHLKACEEASAACIEAFEARIAAYQEEYKNLNKLAQAKSTVPFAMHLRKIQVETKVLIPPAAEYIYTLAAEDRKAVESLIEKLPVCRDQYCFVWDGRIYSEKDTRMPLHPTDLQSLLNFMKAEDDAAVKRQYLPLLARVKKTEVFTIPESDPRVGLRGQCGLRARSNIPKGAFLGFYPGALKVDTETELSQRYLLYIDANYPRAVKRGLGVNPERADKTFIGLSGQIGEPALAHRINASTTDGVFADAKGTEANCGFGYIHVEGQSLPVPFIFALRDIGPGEEFLIDYGPQYWKQISQSVMADACPAAEVASATVSCPAAGVASATVSESLDSADASSTAMEDSDESEDDSDEEGRELELEKKRCALLINKLQKIVLNQRGFDENKAVMLLNSLLKKTRTTESSVKFSLPALTWISMIQQKDAKRQTKMLAKSVFDALIAHER